MGSSNNLDAVEQLPGISKNTIPPNNLPEEVYISILRFLPIEDVVKTSLLSHDWRRRWWFVPDVVFDRKSFPAPYFHGRPRDGSTRKLATFMKYVLKFHKGPINKFEFSAPLEKCYWDALDQWLLKLSRSSVRQLIIDHIDPRYKMPHILNPALFSCETLTILSLQHCKLELPQGFRGLINLTHLNLKDVSFKGVNDLNDLLSRCPLLEHLTLELWFNRTDLKVVAPNLCTLNMDLRGFFNSISLNTPKLSSLSASLIFDQAIYQDPQGRSSGCNLDSLLEMCVNIEKLVIRSTLEFMCVGLGSLNFPSNFNYLRQLEIGLNISCQRQILAALCLLDRCPILNYLLVNSSPFYSVRIYNPTIFFWEKQKLHNYKFDHLKRVDLNWMKGSKDEMKFVKLVLGKAPSVTKISIRMDRDYWSIRKNSTWLQDLISLKRHLAQATMHFEGEIVSDGSSVSSVKNKILEEQHLKMLKMGFYSTELQ